MVNITKTEKEKILERFPTARICRTMKTKSHRHHYYCEEAPRIMSFLKSIRLGQTAYN